MDPAEIGQLLIRMRIDIDALTADGVAQEHFRSQTRGGDTRLFKQFRALKEDGVEGQLR
jgi:hypothetical protein